MSAPSANRGFPKTLGQALVLLILVVLLPLLAAEGAIYYLWFRAQKAAEMNANLEVAHGVAAAFENYVQGLHRHQLALGLALLELDANREHEGLTLLSLSAAEYPAVRCWLWLDSGGQVVFSTDRSRIGSRYADFDRVAKGPANGLGDLSSPESALFPIWRRIDNESGRLLGVVLAEVDGDKLGHLVLQIHRTHGGAFVLFDGQGRLVYRYPEVSDLRHDVWRDADAVLKKALETNQVQVGVYNSPLFGDRRFAARVPIETLGWVAGAGRPVEQAFALALRSLWLVGALNVLMVLLCLAGAGLLSRRIVGRLRALQEHARALGRGEFSHRVDPAGGQELAELGQRFNEMATQLQQRAADVDKAMTELQRSNRELEQFAYVASHDLQEPLRVITGYLQLIERRYRGKLDADGEEFIDFVVDAVKRMQCLIADLLEYSRVGTRGRPFVSTNAEMVLQRAVEALSQAIAETDAQVLHDPLPTVEADEIQLMQLFQNLIGNALKFHGPRRPEVHVSARADKDDWLFSICDNGIGIEPQYREQVFVIFQRLHTREKYPGTGIGLAICKKIVERHGGRIWIESALGGGSVFCFTIPQRRAA